MRWGEVRESDG